MIRQANIGDISRISEILVFRKREFYRYIYHNDQYSFGELQVLTVAREFQDHPEWLHEIWVYTDDFVKGIIRVREREIVQLYVDSFFAGCGIGGELLDFALEHFSAEYLWVLEKNPGAISFYERHGFRHRGVWKYEEGTTECLQLMEQ